jgi:hypothetical protein
MRKGGLFWGVILLIIGLLLLLSNLGIIAVDVWGTIWVVVLIALGLSILLSVVVGPSAAEGESVTIPLEGASSARVRVRHGAGRLRVGGKTAPDALVEGTFTNGLDYRAQRTGEGLNVEISPHRFPFSIAPWNWGREGLGWTFSLNGTIPLSLTFETGASDTRLDLSELHVTDLRLQTGASSVHLTLPAYAGHARAHIEAGAASVSIRVPPGVAAQVQFAGGLASADVDQNRFPRTAGAYRSPDYDTAQNKVDIVVKAGVGSLDIR